MAKYMQDVVQGTTLRPYWNYYPDLFLPSHSLDVSNPYATGVVGTTNYSGYDVSSSAYCQYTTNYCATSQNSYNTKMTSLMDLKFRALFRPQSLLNFIEYGIQNDGTYRHLPYIKSNLHAPTSCLIQDVTLQSCLINWYYSSCNPDWVNTNNASAKYYPPYDSRCRTWYQSAVKYASVLQIIYQTTFTTTTELALTANIAVWQNGVIGGTLLGVINTNYAIQTLQSIITALDYFTHGYCYLLSGFNPEVLVIHPTFNLTCYTLECSEGFTKEEYAAFKNNTLTPLASGKNDSQVIKTFMKNGQEWQLVFVRILYTNVDFILVGVLPMNVIDDTADKIKRSIDSTILTLIVVFVLVLIFLNVANIIYANEMVNSIVNPINELRKVFELVRMNEDLSGRVENEASSADMKVLLEAFSKMMIALRFSNESYAAGNQKRAHEVYSDALNLYTSSNDKRGIGVSLANLAASELARQHYDAAESLFKKSIENADEILGDTLSPLSRAEEIKIERLLSERKEMLADVYFTCDRYEDAMKVLTPALEIDLQNGHMINYALKQCAIARYHKTKNEFVTAEKIVFDLLKLIRTQRSRRNLTAPPTPVEVKEHRVSNEERESAEQIALHRMARVRKESGSEARVVESALIYSLLKNSVMHADTTSKTLITLKKIFGSEGRLAHIEQINWLAMEFNLNVSRDTNSSGFAQNITNGLQPPKRLVICLDHSAAMIGVAFQSAMDNLNTIFELHLNGKDSLSIICFNETLSLALPLTTKKGNELVILNAMDKLVSPSGEQTVMYDALMVGLYALHQAHTIDDWLILVTASDDTASRLSLEKTMDRVLFSKTGLVIIGIGDKVQTAALELLAGSTKRGVYFHASVDKKSINEAFEHAIQIIEMSSSGAV